MNKVTIRKNSIYIDHGNHIKLKEKDNNVLAVVRFPNDQGFYGPVTIENITINELIHNKIAILTLLTEINAQLALDLRAYGTFLADTNSFISDFEFDIEISTKFDKEIDSIPDEMFEK